MDEGVASLLGTEPGVFLGVTVVLMGGAAFLTGQAVANAWGPKWQVMLYSLFLAFAGRFLIHALFQGNMMAWALILDWVVLVGIGLTAYRMTRAKRFASQYPWLYERVGFWSVRERPR